MPDAKEPEVQVSRKEKAKEFKEIEALRVESESSAKKARKAASQADDDRRAFEAAVEALILKTARACDLYRLDPEALVAGLRYVATHGHRLDVVSEWIAVDRQTQSMVDREAEAPGSRQLIAETPAFEGKVRVSIRVGRNVGRNRRHILESAGLNWNGKRGLWWGEVAVRQIAALRETFQGLVAVQDPGLRKYGSGGLRAERINAAPASDLEPAEIGQSPLGGSVPVEVWASPSRAESKVDAGLVAIDAVDPPALRLAPASFSETVGEMDPHGQSDPPDEVNLTDLGWAKSGMDAPSHAGGGIHPELMAAARDIRDVSNGFKHQSDPLVEGALPKPQPRPVPGQMLLRTGAIPLKPPSGSEG